MAFCDNIGVYYRQAKSIFGFQPVDNIGKTAFPAVQAAPAFSSTFEIPLRGAKDMPCLIPCAIDQVLFWYLGEMLCVEHLDLMMSKPMRRDIDI